jgi:cell division protein FtsN
MSKRLFIWIGLLILAGVISAAGWSTYITINRPDVEAPPPAARGKIPQIPSTSSGDVSHKINVPAPTAGQPTPAADQASAPTADAQETASLQQADQKPESDADLPAQPEQPDTQNAAPPEAETDQADGSPDSQGAVPNSETVASTDRQKDQAKTESESAPEQAPVPPAEPQQQDVAPDPTSAAVQTPSDQSTEPADANTTQAPAPEQAPQAEPKQLDTNPYSIQVGAYRNKQYAENAAAELARKGYESYIIEDADSKTRPWYIVRFGHFANRKEAQDFLAAYQHKEKKQAIIAQSGTR